MIPDYSARKLGLPTMNAVKGLTWTHVLYMPKPPKEDPHA